MLISNLSYSTVSDALLFWDLRRSCGVLGRGLADAGNLTEAVKYLGLAREAEGGKTPKAAVVGVLRACSELGGSADEETKAALQAALRETAPALAKSPPALLDEAWMAVFGSPRSADAGEIPAAVAAQELAAAAPAGEAVRA